MPKVTFIIDGETTVIEFEHGKVPYSNHGTFPCSNSMTVGSPSMM